MKLSFKGRSGTVEEVGIIVTRLKVSGSGRMYIPNGHLTTAIVEEAGQAS